jgi:hypothetical protein
MKQKPISQPWLRFGKHAFLFLALSASLNTYAQSDTIRIVNPNRYHYELNQNRIYPSMLDEVMAGQHESHRAVKNAQATRFLSTLVGAGGGLLFGYALGSAIRGADLNLEIMAVGGVCMAVSIILDRKSKIQFKESIEMHNAAVLGRVSQPKTLILGLGPNGIRLQKSF